MLTASLSTTIFLGFLLGLRHALDADHVAAVTSLAGARDGLRQALRTGLSWGVGHALVIAVAGGTLVALQTSVPERLALLSELLVGLMLVALGVVALASALSRRLHAHEHEHGGIRHVHLHFHPIPHRGEVAHQHPHPFRLALRPFLVGSLHGLAGSAAAVLLVLTTIPTALLGCLYLGVFGIGTTTGMVLMSAVLGAPLMLVRRRALWLHRTIRAAAGALSVSLGCLLVWRIGILPGLFG